MTDFHRYQDWLTEIEREMSILDGAIVAKYENTYKIPLVDCDTPKKALNEALAFSAKILSDEKGLPWDALALHLLRLASKGNNFPIDAEHLYHPYKIRFAGEFDIPKILAIDNRMEFKGSKPNYLNLTLCSTNTNLLNELHIKKLHCFTSDMHELVSVRSIGLALTNRHIILCLPENSKWNLFKGSDVDNSEWHQQNWTRLAIGFTDINNINTVYSELCGFLGNELIKIPLWAKGLTHSSGTPNGAP